MFSHPEQVRLVPSRSYPVPGMAFIAINFGRTWPSWRMLTVLMSLGSALESLAEETHQDRMQVPGMLDCEGEGWPQEWRTFRLAATQAAERGFARSAVLEQMAAEIENKWGHWLCPRQKFGEQCQKSSDLSYDFIPELHRECRGSNNFERYLVRHYFRNDAYKPLEAPSGFCLFGYAMALMVLAWHRLPEQVQPGLRYTYMARHLLGHYHSFDFLESSSWPVSSFLILVNFNSGGNWERLTWRETEEAAKAVPSVAFRLPGEGRLRGSPSRPHLVVWQFCIHASTAGEAVTMITRFLHDDYNVEFRGNSLATKMCRNYRPMLCAEGRNFEFLGWVYKVGSSMPFPELSKAFRQEMMPQLSRADVWMCSIPAVWCWLLWDAAQAHPDALGRTTPIFAYLGLPILQHVQRNERTAFLEAFVALGKNERNIMAANNAYLAEEVAWQTGLRVPTLRIHGLHTNATYLPLRISEVLISRPGTSGGWQECILNRFVDANPDYTLRFVQFTDLLDPHTIEEVYVDTLSYQSLSHYRAVVGFPYDTSLMFFWEFYSMNMPSFVPFQLWHWGIFGQHTRPDLGELQLLPGRGPVLSTLTPEEDRMPNPFFDGFGALDLQRAIFWSKYTDWAMFPHVQYFKSLPDLMSQLVEVDLQAVSAAMKNFNEECLVKSTATWRYVVERFLDLQMPAA
eukprot:s2264_g4.t1